MAAVHVVHVVYSLGTGGMEKGVTTLVTNGSADIRHTIVCLSTSGAMANRLPPGTPVVEMHKPPGNSLRFLARLGIQLRRVQPDVVHTRNWGGLDGVIAALLAGHRGVVHGEHGWEMADSHGMNRRRRWVRKLLSLAIDEYTCVSRDMETWLTSSLEIRRPVTQIYNGIDTEVFKPGSGRALVRAELGIEPDIFVVGIVGRLDPIKDHATLFRAVHSLRAEGIEVLLLVVGSGPEQERLAQLAGDGVRFLGNRTDVPDVLRALDAFALTSVNEGISNTILEAMATSLPIVATRVGGNMELVEDGVSGVLVDVGDDVAVAAALARYARDRSCARAHGHAARRRAVESFSVQRMIEGYERVWRRVATKHARRHRKGDGSKRG